MGNYTRINLLFVTILSVFFMSFTIKDVERPATSVDYHSSSFSIYSSFTTPGSCVDFQISNNSYFQDYSDLRHEYRKGFNSQFKYKKKLKRLQQSVTGLRLPVKYIEWSANDPSARCTYTKPHFLTPLHRYLFRLTPF